MNRAAGVLSILLVGSAWAAEPLPRTIADVITRVEAARDPPGASAAREILKRPQPSNASLDFHIERASAAANIGQTGVLLAERRRIVELTEGARNQPKHLLDLGIVELTAGAWLDAERIIRRAATASTA